jgi:precorrin-3B synthase
MRDLVAAEGVEAIGRTTRLGPDLASGCSRRTVDAGLHRSDLNAPGSPIILGSPIVILGLDPRIPVPADLAALPDTVAALARRSSDDERASIVFLGLGVPFGRVSASDLCNLASGAEAVGTYELRLTPWRVIIVPVSSADAAHALSSALSNTAFIVDSDDPRRRVAACPGAPFCARGTTPVRDDAVALAARAAGAPGSGIVLHVSGCEKGCAHPHKASLTLVAREGRYRLVRDGRASDSPIARDLTLDQAADLLMTHLASGAT